MGVRKAFNLEGGISLHCLGECLCGQIWSDDLRAQEQQYKNMF